MMDEPPDAVPDRLADTVPVPSSGERPSPDPAATITAPFQTLVQAHREHRYEAKRLEPGERIGHYEVISPIGQGGFSAVYAARHVYLKHELALKTLRVGHVDAEASERFLREAQTLAVLSTRHVIRVFDAGMWNDVPYIILEKIDGEDLRQLVSRRGRLSPNRTMDLLEELGRVLVQQEKRGILHRDIKPGNILQRSDGSFCLLDYGLAGRNDGAGRRAGVAALEWASVTAPGQVFGTTLYMAPEQFEGRADHRTDMYLLGMTAWECLAGEPARKWSGGPGLNLSELAALAREPVPSARSVRADVPEGLDRVLGGLLAPVADERYGSAAEFLHDLETFRYEGKPPSGSTRGDVFVAMPFARRFGSIYAAIERACSEVQLRPRRMDRFVFVEDIWNQIVQEIDRCAVVVADFSRPRPWQPPNANVLTEAAHARAKGKALILISQDPPERLPFDWRHMPIIRYSTAGTGLNDLSRQLVTKLRHAMLERVR